jgi:hypothetical protein
LDQLLSSSDLILLTLLSNAALCFSKESDEPKALLIALGAFVLGQNCKTLNVQKLIDKVYFRIKTALKTLCGEKEAAASLKLLKQDGSVTNIV